MDDKPTEPHLHITPWMLESFDLVDRACDRWLRRRAQLRRRASEHRADTPNAHLADLRRTGGDIAN